jgi:hypothetical protein
LFLIAKNNPTSVQGFCSDGESQWMMDMGEGMWWNATTKVVTCGRVMTTAIMEKGQRAFTHLQAQQLS